MTKCILGPGLGAQHECPPTGLYDLSLNFVLNLIFFQGNQIVLNEANVGKGEELRAGKPRREDDVEVEL